MLANARFALSAGALFIGIAAQGCSAPTASSPHFVHGSAEISGATSSAAKTDLVKKMVDPAMPRYSGVQIVELNGFYQGCTDQQGLWSVAVDGSDIQLDNPALMVVQNDVNCQLIATEVRADQLYEASAPLQMSQWGLSQASSFTPLASEDGGAPQVAFYASGINTDPDYYSDFMLLLIYSPGPNDTSVGTGATFTTNSASLQTDQVPAPDYSVDMSQMSVQVDANQMVQSASGPASFNFSDVPGMGYVIDDGTLPPNPTFAQLDALYTGQSPTPIQMWNNFSIDQSAFSLQGNQLPLVRNVVIASEWLNGVASYQFISITFNPANDATAEVKGIRTVRK